MSHFTLRCFQSKHGVQILDRHSPDTRMGLFCSHLSINAVFWQCVDKVIILLVRRVSLFTFGLVNQIYIWLTSTSRRLW